MYKDKNSIAFGFEELESVSHEFIRAILLVCEVELAKHDDDIAGLPSAAMAVRESIITFLALVGQK